MSDSQPWARGTRVQSTFLPTRGKEAWIRGVNAQHLASGKFLYYISFFEKVPLRTSGVFVAKDESGVDIFSYSEIFLHRKDSPFDELADKKYGIVSYHQNRSHPPRHD